MNTKSANVLSTIPNSSSTGRLSWITAYVMLSRYSLEPGLIAKYKCVREGAAGIPSEQRSVGLDLGLLMHASFPLPKEETKDGTAVQTLVIFSLPKRRNERLCTCDLINSVLNLYLFSLLTRILL